MSENPLTLFCLVDGEATSNAFSVKVPLSGTVDDLKKLIKIEKTPRLDDVAADELTLWRVMIPDSDDPTPIFLEKVPGNKKRLRATNKVSIFGAVLPEDTIHVLVEPPPLAEKIKRWLEDPQNMPQKKKIRIEEAWAPFTASDGNLVDLPPSWINILASSKFVPEPRAAFAHLRDNLQPGDAIIIPSMGQVPKEYGSHGGGQTLFVTEQMLELWEDIRGDKDRTYRRVLSGPMGVGKSYLSYFLAARAYAEGWPVLYIADAKVLDKEDEGDSALEIVKRFLALNKDILTGIELGGLVDKYKGERDVSKTALSEIFDTLIKSQGRRTLLLVDEHGKLFEKEKHLPEKFASLVPLSSFNWWEEDNVGTRLIFTGTAHAKYEMTILADSYRTTSVVFVGPLSRNVFANLLDTYPRLQAPEIKIKVTELTNCVPRELVNLSAFLEHLPDPISVKNVQDWTEGRIIYFKNIAVGFYKSLDQSSKDSFYKALLHTFLGSTGAVNFEWDFVDLGLIYRSIDTARGGIRYHILCRSAQQALLELFKTLPLPEDTKRRLCAADLRGDEFEAALCHQLICANKPILLNATDLNGKNPTIISLDFSHCDTIRDGRASLGNGHDKVLARGYTGHPRFDFMLGRMFIQVSVSDFGSHNTGSASISNAFTARDTNGTNQIERYLNELYGPGHTAKIQGNRFVVNYNSIPVPDFCVVYIRGSPGKPSHRDLVKKFPDIRHVTFEELMEKLFKNIV